MLNKKYFAFGKPLEYWFRTAADSHMTWKDTNSVFLGNSDLAAKRGGVTAANSPGKTDFDVAWYEHAPMLIKNDRLILKLRKTHLFLETANSAFEKQITLLSCKTPLLSNTANVVGIFVLCLETYNKSLSDLLNEINKLGILAGNAQLLSSYLNISQKQLSPAERRCLYFLARGRSMKEIANILGNSPRTIETHIERIKQKLNCHTRSQLLDKLFEEGLVS